MILRKALNQLRRARDLSGFLVGLPPFLRRRMTLDGATELLKRRVADRERNFLEVVRAGVFGFEESPYLPLLHRAQCTFGDLRHEVRSHGLEPTLEALRDEGVYVTFDEFAGRAPLVRGDLEIPVHPSDFSNPFTTEHFEMSTSGSSGRARPVPIDLQHLWARVPQQIVSDTIHGFMGKPLAIWFDGLPGNALNTILTRVAFDNVPDRWFSPTAGRDARPLTDFPMLRLRMAERAILTVSRLSGAPVPLPKPVSLGQADIVARWASEALERDGGCGIKTMLSRALRVCLAAEGMDVDLTGLTIAGGGEPPTPAKAGAIARTGARLISNYHFQEVGAVGKACMNPVGLNDQHLLRDHLAMITRHREVPGFDLEVDAFCFTTLLPTARKLMLNVETDDYGIVERRECGCPWDEFGFTTHLRDIRSFRKLTGEGVTLVGTDMVHILEEVLPNRFGGSPFDYQLVEEEDDDGFTRLSLTVSPRVDVPNERELVQAVLESVPAGPLRSLWSQAGSVRIRRGEPVWTSRGKFLPLHLKERAGSASDPDASSR